MDDDHISVVLAQLQRLDNAVEKEFTLVSDRMTWLVISESFIFGGYASAVNSYDVQAPLRRLIIGFLLGLPVLGTAIAVTAWLAIAAAHRAAEGLKRQREDIEPLIPGPPVKLVSSNDRSHSAGNVPARWLPGIFVVIWTLIFAFGATTIHTSETVATVVSITLIPVVLVATVAVGRRTWRGIE
jgi:uncharacterized membrane protein YedE/YeeE